MQRSLVTPRYTSALPAAAIMPPLTFLLPSSRPKPYNARAPPLITDNHGSMSLTRSQAPPPLRPPLRSERELFMDSSLRKVTRLGCEREVRGLDSSLSDLVIGDLAIGDLAIGALSLSRTQPTHSTQ